jgi:hypothetical protein
MTTRKTDLERREDRKMKSVLYNHQSTRRHIAESNAGPTKGDAVRRRHADEKAELGRALHKESLALTHRHTLERSKHDGVSQSKPIEMEARHKKELADMKRDHDARSREQATRHRRELDLVED